ncbi:MAG TPA: acyltransferase, partial [Chloroflexia bacterium]|nr:acyltransferase [Chloroflexia bacterium]
WPLCLILVLRYQPRRLPLVLMSLIAMSIAMRFALVLLGTSPTGWRLYAGTDTRVDELLIGCLLSVLLSRGTFQPPVKVTRAAACLSLLALLLICVLCNFDNPAISLSVHMGGFTLVALLVAVVILHLRVSPLGRLARLLSVRPLVKIGVVSYGIYLWHSPIFVLMPPSSWADWPIRLLAVAMTAAAVILSYRYVERPFMRLERPALRGSAAVAQT